MALHIRVAVPAAQPHIHHHEDQHLLNLPLTHLSGLSPFSGLILAIVLILLLIIKQYLLSPSLLHRLYINKYTRLSDDQRRSFTNHHIAGGTKIIILIIAIYPFVSVAFQNGTLDTPLRKGGNVTMGDILVTATQMLVGMYIFELIYRTKISPISTMHHLGAILVAESAIALNLQSSPEADAVIEFVLCTVWGAFDIVCEMCPHVAMILYRLYPSNHRFLCRLFLFAAITTFVGTIAETIVVFYLFGSLWSQWELAFKIVTPVLHVAFSATQLHGSRIFVAMWMKQRRECAEEKRMRGEIEKVTVSASTGKEISPLA